jgi:hypothetical protein
MILTNVAKAKQILSSGGKGSVSASGGGTASSSATQMQPSVEPSVNLFGSANQGNNVNSQGGNIMNNMTVTAQISESEVTSTQLKVNKMKLAGVL